MKEPLNLVISGVGGQGNVLIGGLIGEALVKERYAVTIGETYGVSQRGGPVMSHIRISQERGYGPIVPFGGSDVVLGLEPLEALRVLVDYGNSETKTIANVRPIYPIDVLSGEAEYPAPDEVQRSMARLSSEAWFLDASGIALSLGLAVLTNMVMVGALVATALLPLSREVFERQLSESMSGKRLALNLQAFGKGFEALKN